MNQRYQTRWANGAWRVFDTHNYTTVRLCYMQADANAACHEMNLMQAWKVLARMNWLKGTFQINKFNNSPQGQHALREAEKKEKA